MVLALLTQSLLWLMKVSTDHVKRQYIGVILIWSLKMQNMTSVFEQCPGKRLPGSFAGTRFVLLSWRRHGEF